MAGRIQAAYMLAPLVMDLADRKIPVKIVSLGHRSGAVIMVRTDSPYQRFKDLAGKRIAIPSRFAVDFLFLRKMLIREGMTPKDVQIIEMAPPDMPAALYAKAVDAYCTGEPFGAAAQHAGYGRVLRMTRDEWRNYICCVLTVREELIAANRPLVQDLVDHVLGAGQWLDQKQENRNKAVAIAAGRKFFNQDPNIIRFVMENPVDRVTYGDLRMIRAEFEELMQLSVEAARSRARSPTRNTWTRVSPRLRAPPPSALSHRTMPFLRVASRCCLLLLGIATAVPAAPAPASRPACSSRRARRPNSPCAARRQRADAGPLSRQGRADVVRLHALRGRVPGDARHAGAGARRARPGADAVQVVFVTVDPERDPAPRLKAYLAAFDASFVGATGTPERSRRCARATASSPARCRWPTATRWITRRPSS
jgi:ABC-type nitrate/sulfonate/bicarbonate transport system substrate-binding protein